MSSRTKHNFAAFEDAGVMVVEVKRKHVEKYGEEALWRSIQEHPLLAGDDWDDTDEWQVVIAYWDDDEPYFFGDEEVVAFVADIPVDDMPWADEPLYLEWED